MASITDEQTARLSAVVAALSRAWTVIENPVVTSRGMFGLFPRVKASSVEQLFRDVGAKIQLNYLSQVQRGIAANLRVISGTIGDQVYFVARCTPATVEGTFNVELDLAPGGSDADESALLTEGAMTVCEDLLGPGLLTTEGLGAFLRRQLGRARGDKIKLLAAIAGVLSDEMRASAGEDTTLY